MFILFGYSLSKYTSYVFKQLFVFRLIKIGDKNVPEARGNSASGGIEKEILFERSELISFSKRKECSANFYSAVTFLCYFLWVGAKESN